MHGKGLITPPHLLPSTGVKGPYLPSKIFSTEKLTEAYLIYTSPATGKDSTSPTHHLELVSTQSSTTSQRSQLTTPPGIPVIASHGKPGRKEKSGSCALVPIAWVLTACHTLARREDEYPLSIYKQGKVLRTSRTHPKRSQDDV